MILSFVSLAEVLVLNSWRSFSPREAILLRRDSRASSFSVRESRIESLAMLVSMSDCLAVGFWWHGCCCEGEENAVWVGGGREGGVGREGGKGGSSVGWGVAWGRGGCRDGVQATCRMLCRGKARGSGEERRNNLLFDARN